jgi:hypothetical protein
VKKWVLSALAYLIVVLGSYYAYSAITAPSIEDVPPINTEQHNE